MWVIVPVKQFREAKNRLSGSLSGDQRAKLSKLMVMDVLEALSTSDVVDGITVVSAESEMVAISERYRAEHILTDTDSGQSVDVANAIASQAKSGIGKVAIIPSDVPDLSHADLRQLESAHQRGVTLCPAPMDGGTNGLVFSPPLPISLLYGKDSLKKFQEEAARQGVDVRIARIPGLERDIDRPEDLEWLRKQPTGGHAWAYARDLNLEQA